MSDYQLPGKITLISETQTFSSGFTKREFVVTTEEERFPQEIKVECVKEKCELLDAFALGDQVNVHFNLRGHEYNGRHYVNLQAWKIERADGGGGGGGGGSAASAGGGGPSSLDEPPAGHGQDAVGDDIPF